MTARFPPRSALPRSIAVEAVPLLGTTWYERGVRYWLRRVAMVVVGAIVLTLVVTLLWGLFSGIRQSSVTAFWIALGVEIAYSAAVVVWFCVRVARRWNDPRPAPRPRAARSAGTAGAVLGTLARAGSVVGAVVLVLGSLVFVGLYVALFLLMLMPVTVWEQPARLAMAERLHTRGIDVS